MLFVDAWAHTQKVPISQKEIVLEMNKHDVSDFGVVKAIRLLVKKKYLRRGQGQSNTCVYIQLRRV